MTRIFGQHIARVLSRNCTEPRTPTEVKRQLQAKFNVTATLSYCIIKLDHFTSASTHTSTWNHGRLTLIEIRIVSKVLLYFDYGLMSMKCRFQLKSLIITAQ